MDPLRRLGHPETGQSVINVTNGKLVRLFVDDEPFDVRSGERRAHSTCLTSAPGTLNRTAECVLAGRKAGPRLLDPAGVVHPAGGRCHLL